MTEQKKEVHDKPLDKMTVTELREVAKELPDITGVHGMKKAELLEAIIAVEGGVDVKDVQDVPKKKSTEKGKPKAQAKASVQDLKHMIKSIRFLRQQALADKDKKKAKIYRRRISRLKKKTRQAA